MDSTAPLDCTPAHLASALGEGLALAGTSLAGHPFAGNLAPGQCVRIFTGAVLPTGADTVAMQENVVADGTRARLTGALTRVANVREAGEDIRAGAVALPAGTRLGPPQIAL